MLRSNATAAVDADPSSIFSHRPADAGESEANLCAGNTAAFSSQDSDATAANAGRNRQGPAAAASPLGSSSDAGAADSSIRTSYACAAASSMSQEHPAAAASSINAEAGTDGYEVNNKQAISAAFALLV